MTPEMRKLARNIERLLEVMDQQEQPISEDEAAALLNISKKTMQNYVSEGRLTGKYVINAIGNRMYYKSKLLKAVS